MTMLEIVVVLIIIAGLMYLGAMAASRLTRSRLNDDTTSLASVIRRSGQLAAETGLLHRVVLDLDAGTYRVEVCEGGPASIAKNPEQADQVLSVDQKRTALEDAQRRLQSVPQNMLPQGDEESGQDMALALANQLGARRTCSLAAAESGKFDNKDLMLTISPGVKIRSVWVQHLEEPVSSGLVALHFFPVGSAEKAIVELGDDDDAFSILIHGLTGRVEVRDSPVDRPEDFFLRDVNGDAVPES
jgi:type II secretory pathway pseudopilin PulG